MKNLLEIKNQALKEIEETKSLKDLELLEKKYLGRKKGEITKILRGLKDLPLEERKKMGSLANEIKREIQEKFKIKNLELQARKVEVEEFFDLTLPGRKIKKGHLHPLTQFMRKVKEVFLSMGYEIVEGPEVELVKYNFDLLNIPEDHPARDIMDTFYISPNIVLRTHTSPVQIRAMEERKPPVRIIVPGRVFRHEATDPTHETTFYQLEGLVIDKNVSLVNLISTLKNFVQEIFGKRTKIRVRPGYFPFTEPSIELDISCLICFGKGCNLCKNGWLEILGAGMVHRKVLENMKVDPEKYSGFAFGMGIDRLMMLYYQINDIRLSYSGDLRFLYQF